MLLTLGRKRNCHQYESHRRASTYLTNVRHRWGQTGQSGAVRLFTATVTPENFHSGSLGPACLVML